MCCLAVNLQSEKEHASLIGLIFLCVCDFQGFFGPSNVNRRYTLSRVAYTWNQNRNGPVLKVGADFQRHRKKSEMITISHFILLTHLLVQK